ncbi:MAG: metallophosphoesterase [Candidatus Methanospirareceae archaeon]
MKLGVISDTHDHIAAISTAVEVFNREGIDLLVHAGDFVSPFTSKPFQQLNAQFVGIFGNNDGDKLLLTRYYRENGVGELHEDPYEFERGSWKIMVTHKPELVNPLAASGLYDLVIYGHTHQAVIDAQADRTWIINPGECCGYLTGRKTVALLDLERGAARLLALSL